MQPRVLHVSSPTGWRGGEQQLAYTNVELNKQGVFQLILCNKDGKLAAYCKENNINHSPESRKGGLDFSFAKKLAKLVKENNINIVHPHDSLAHSACLLAYMFFGMKQSIVLHRRVDYAVNNSIVSRYKYNIAQIKRIICVSEEVKRVLAPSLKKPEKAVVVHSGIDLNKFKLSNENLLRNEYNLDDDTCLIGNVAAVTQQKDYFTFVETARVFLSKNSKVKFFIIGGGDQIEEIKELVKTYGLQEAIIFTGFREDINAVLPCLDILLFTSEKEGLGTTLLDAFAAKVAVVATNAGGIPELVKHGETGLLAPVKDTEQIAENLQLMVNNHKLRTELINKALSFVNGFSKEETANKILAVYQEVLSE